MLFNDCQLTIFPRRAMLLQRQQALCVFSIQKIHQVLLFLNKASFSEFAFQLAKNLLLGETLPPEIDQGVDLIVTRHSLYTLASLAVKLIYQHFNQSAHVLISTQSRCGRRCRRSALVFCCLHLSHGHLVRLL